MIFTQIEKHEQRQLMKDGAELYCIDVTNDVTQQTMQVKLYEKTEEDALLLARRISKRSEKTLLTELNFNLAEIKENKLGLIIPWKDPVNKRSVDKAINMPLKRSKSMIKDIVSASIGRNQIHLPSMEDEYIQKMKTACLKHDFVSFILLVIGLYLYFVGSGNSSDSLSVILCLLVSLTTYIKTRKARQSIRTEEISRKYIKEQD